MTSHKYHLGPVTTHHRLGERREGNSRVDPSLDPIQITLKIHATKRATRLPKSDI